MLAAPGRRSSTLGQVVARIEADGATSDVTAPVAGFLVKGDDGLVVRAEDVVEREYLIPHNAKILVDNGAEIRAGDAITDGPINPQEYLDTRGKDAVQRYLVKEVQKVYKSQGVTINDKHIEIIVRQMLRKVRIDQPGDVDLLPTELVDRLEFEEHNNRVLAEGGEPATAQTVLLGVTKASLNTSSFLAAASFQETTRVLTEAAINGAKDHLIGLKENVIIGKLIPAGTGAPANVAARKERERRAALEALAGEALEDLGSRVQPVPRGRREPCRRTTRRPASRWRRPSPGLATRTTTTANPFLADRRASDEARRRRSDNPLPARKPRRPSPRPPTRTDRIATDRRETDSARAARRTFDTFFGPLLHSAFVASGGVRPRRVRRGPSRPHHAARSVARRDSRATTPRTARSVTTDRRPRTDPKGAASSCRRSASSCATAASARSRRSRRRPCARTGTACDAARCRSRAPPRSGASACRSGR